MSDAGERLRAWLVPGLLFGLTAMFRPEYLLVAAAFVVLAAIRVGAARGWKPGLAVNAYQDLKIPGSAVPVKASPQVSIDVTGTLQASFNGSGQYISALNPGPAAVPSDYNFTLAKVDGQWRIKHTGYKRTYEEIQSREGVPGLRLTADWFATDGRSSLI